MNLNQIIHKSYFESPVGIICLKADDEFLYESKFVIEIDETTSENNLLIKLQKELTDFFERKIIKFDVPIHPSIGTEFQRKVWHELSKIKFGQTLSYSDFTSSFADPKAIRAVSNAIAKNPFLILVPCHRVLGKNQSLTGYSGGVDKKAALLHFENPSTFLF